MYGIENISSTNVIFDFIKIAEDTSKSIEKCFYRRKE
jgi:hypothetical protein